MLRIRHGIAGDDSIIREKFMRQIQSLVMALCFVGLSAFALPVTGEAQNAESEPNVCLRNVRIWSWDLVDSSTLRIRARGAEQDYLVHLQGPCTGLQTVLFALRFQATTNLGCVGPGDRVHYEASGIGPQVCFVLEVTLAPVEEGD